MSNFPTLDGLNNIDVDNGNLTNITCQTFIATTSAQVPTMIAGSNDNNAASTEFVTDAVSTATADLVTTNTSQTITLGSVKTFLTLPQSTATVSNNEDLTTKKYVDDNFINIIGNQTLTTGIKTFTVLPQSAATPSSNTDLTTKKYVDDNFINIVGNQTLTTGVKTFTNLPQSTATPSNNAELTNKSYVDNSVAGLTGTYVGLTGNQSISGIKTFNSLPQSTVVPIANSDLTNKLYVDNLFSGATGATGGVFVTLLGNQTLGTGVKTFTNLPSCTAVPINNDDLTNKLYVDNLFSGATGATGGVFVTLTGNQTLGAGVKTFTNLPGCTGIPSSNSDLTNKLYVDNLVSGLTGTYVGLTGAQSISGIKTFNSLPQSTVVPSNNADFTNKLYVDNLVAGVTGSYVTLGGNQVLTAGIKTFTDLPECTAVPSNNANLTNKSYVDNNFVNLVGSQTLTTGVKTFNTLPQSTVVPSNNADFTNKLYVDNAVAGVVGATGTFVTLGTAQTITGSKVFNTLPNSTVVPSANSDFVNKLYVDNSIAGATGTYVTLTGTQTVTGSKDFNASTTTIRGSLLDVFPTTTQLYSTTTNIAGSTLFVNSTNNSIAGTTTDITSPTTTISGATACNITSPSTNLSGTTTTISGSTTFLNSPTIVVNNTCNSFYVDASYSNFVGDETLLQSPYTTISSLCTLCEVNPVTLRLQSPTIDVQSSCGNFNIIATNTTFTGTNCNLTGTNATAFTQASSDNSTKIATTAFVNDHTLANYMTTNTNQSIPTAIKTYGGKQVFNAGTACNTYDATGVTDMTLANNSAVGILSIAGTRIQTDAYGVRLALDRYNLQLSEGTFIQPNDAPGFNDYTKPDFVFGVNKNTGYVDIVGVPNSAQGSIQMNNLAGIFSWFAGYNQSTLFTISHSIITTSSAIASMNEAEVYFYFQDFNTGIVRYTTPNLATTTGFALPASSTVVRPVITFTLTTAQLPQGDYRIFGYSRVTNAYAVNAGVLSVNFGLPASPSIETAIQNYNTPIDYTFTSRNLYHCFRNYVAGVYIVNNIATQQNIMTPLFYSITDFTNMMSQPTISGGVSTPAVTGGSAVGNFTALSVNNADNYYLVYPNYSLILYDTVGWTGTIYINFKNTTSNPVMVAPTTTQRGSSCRIYFDEVELIKY